VNKIFPTEEINIHALFGTWKQQKIEMEWKASRKLCFNSMVTRKNGGEIKKTDVSRLAENK
jgi:hypothetical protein